MGLLEGFWTAPRALAFQPLDSSLGWEEGKRHQPAESVLVLVLVSGKSGLQQSPQPGVGRGSCAQGRASSGEAQGPAPASSDVLVGLFRDSLQPGTHTSPSKEPQTQDSSLGAGFGVRETQGPPRLAV